MVFLILWKGFALLSQEMGFDSIPFEEPELFAARSGPEANNWVTDRQDSTLHLKLDSQDDLGNSVAEVGPLLLAFLYIGIPAAKVPGSLRRP